MPVSSYQSHSLVIGRVVPDSQGAICIPERLHRRRSVVLPEAYTILDTPRPVVGNEAYKCAANSHTRLHPATGMRIGLHCPMTGM